MFFLHILILYHLLEEVIFTLYYLYTTTISYITGWKYEYVYGSFKECLDMLADGEIDLLGSVSYTPERAESIDYSTYAEGTERYWIYTREEHANLADGDLKQMNGCRIGATDGSYQKELLEKWLDSNQIQAEVVICKAKERYGFTWSACPFGRG